MATTVEATLAEKYAGREHAVLGEPLTLPCGAVLPNRIVKAAMTEQLADKAKGNAPTPTLIRLYERWGKGGTGTLITGNVMVDRRALEGPRNVVVEDEQHLRLLREWAERAQANGAKMWMQISHPGRQTPRGVSELVVAPSAVPVKGMGPLFTTPREVTETEIEDIISRFAATAGVAQKAGFHGVQIHGAHGYLVSAFLSPLVNLREDAWGGTPGKRMRFLMEIVRAVRARVGAAFPVSVKLNSADFQRGGFSEEDSMAVVQALEAGGVDLIEISGGNYENPMMVSTGEVGAPTRESTRQREAFFLEYAQKVRRVTNVPLMLTGGLRTVSTMAEIILEGYVDVVGLARPLAIDPDFSQKAIEGSVDRALPVNIRVGVRQLDDMLQSMWHQDQMRRMGQGLQPDPRLNKYGSLLRNLYLTFVG